MPGENLTRTEAAERAATITTSAYEVHLDLTSGEESFSSTTTIRFAATGPATFVDLIADSVQRIGLNGAAVPVAAFADSRIALEGLAAENELVVEATCRYMNTGEGLHRFTDPVDGETYLYSQFEVADAKRVFACFDQPDLKASFSFTVTAPAHWSVISNAPAAEVSEPAGAEPATRTWTFAPTEVMSTYITAVIAGPYHEVRSELTSRDGRTIPLGVYCRSSLAEHLDAENILDITRAGFRFYEEAFDQPYPFTKYDQLFVPEFNAGAMENAGAVTFLENYVFRSKVPEAMVERRAVTILHELAHMWFGDLVTMRWWNDLWLNESFAEYASTLATAEATQWTQAWTTFTSLEKNWAYRQDQLPSTHPVVAEINDLEDVEVNFDGITYAKGASVLKQLVAWVGQEEFLTGVQRYFAKHAWGNTELPDLLVELEATSGRDLSAWSKLWLEQAGVTLLRPEIETDDDGVITSFSILQEAPEEHPTLRPHRLAVGGYDVVRDGDAVLQRTTRVEIDVTGERTEVPELAGRQRPDLILLNDDDLAYAKIRLDSDSLEAATSHLDGFADSLPRALVLTAAWDMTRDGEWPARRFLDLALRAVATETDSTVVLVLLRQIATTLGSYVAPEVRDEASSMVASRLLDLARSAEPGSDSQLQLIRSFTDHAVDEGHFAVLEALLGEDAEAAATTAGLVGLEIDTDLRWALVHGLAAGGRADEAVLDAELKRDSTAAGQQQAGKARALVPEADRKAQAWADVVDGDDLPNAVQRNVIAGFTHVHDHRLLEPYAERYFAALERVWKEKTNQMAQQVVSGLYPIGLAGRTETVDIVAMSHQWLEAHPDAPAALRRLVIEALDGAERAVRAQGADRAAR
ncbi:aminopeptidase N [Bogoriella caseilytica]|uniref:Aminopeptidase N n=1 Tax=Bogoriella caseilytica TaxID=56055 RepID=A0A3N2BFB6_9MICO|nr:aminopeptidase N [Bogoriella caseilytica]ROR73900.1 membrane alanyl aminopeptidase [Bogoriella caseilytica]